MFWYSVAVIFAASTLILGGVMMLRPELPVSWQLKMEIKLRCTMAASPLSYSAYRIAGFFLIGTAVWVAAQVLMLAVRL